MQVFKNTLYTTKESSDSEVAVPALPILSFTREACSFLLSELLEVISSWFCFEAGSHSGPKLMVLLLIQFLNTVFTGVSHDLDWLLVCF